ncbi:MAG TPA: alpha/beta fold hydrolase, partial [Nakamurella sp.]
THGWPGSFLEFEQVIAPLADGDRAGSFHVVCPSLPGYGFSGKPTEPGWDIHRIARGVDGPDAQAGIRALCRGRR